MSEKKEKYIKKFKNIKKIFFYYNFIISYLIEGIPCFVRSDVVRTEVSDKFHHARSITDRDVFRSLQHGIIEDESLEGTSESLTIVESGDAY